MRRFLLLLAGALLVAMIVPGAVAAKKPTAGTVSRAVTGTYAGGTFAGNFTITRFAQQGGGIVAVGNLTGTVTDGVTGPVGMVDQTVALPVTFGSSGAAVAAAPATCDILHLTLGPLNLNLLGLMVHLNEIHLDITAQQAPGNLLGNLLCAVAGLLDTGGPLSAITALLNQILGILQGL